MCGIGGGWGLCRNERGRTAVSRGMRMGGEEDVEGCE